MDKPYYGPTVWEIAQARLYDIKLEEAELSNEKRILLNRLANPKYSNMQEAERVASESEPFQRTKLTEQ